MEESAMKFVGIDYHKRYSVVCIVDEAGDVVVIERIEHSHPERFASLIGAHTPCRAAFEATMNWGWLYELLETIPGLERIVMANALQVRLIASAQVKTDKVDARKLAHLLRANMLPSSHIPDRATRDRKEVLRQRMFWVRQRTRVRNRIHRLLGRQHNLAMPQVSDLFGRKGRAALNALQLAPPDDVLLSQQLAMLDVLGQQIAQLERMIAGAGATDASVQRLASLPGVGLILGHVMATEIDGVDRFGSAEQLCSYAGLVPTTSSSGGHTYNGHLVQGCNKWLRWAFVESAWVAIGCSAYFGGFYRHHQTRGKKANVAILIVARRLCQIAFHLLKEQRNYEVRTNTATFPGSSQSNRMRQAA
jgi:transposase